MNPQVNPQNILRGLKSGPCDFVWCDSLSIKKGTNTHKSSISAFDF